MLDELEDHNGYIPVENRPLSKVGVFPYLGRSIGAPEPDKIYYVYRPAEELSNEETINSFKLVPLIDEHTKLGKDATPAEKKGIHGVTGENIYFKDGTLYGNLKVFSEAMKNLIEGGKKQLSLGYDSNYVFESGEFEGQKYDAIQTALKGNHIALVDEGRMGKEVSVVDEALKTVVTMDSNEILLQGETMNEEQLKLLLDAINGLSAKIDAMKPTSDEGEEETKPTGDIETKPTGGNAGTPPTKDEEEKKAGGDGENETEVLKQKVADMEEQIKATGDANDIKKAVLKEVAEKTRIADSLSAHIGTFDHLEMDLKGVVAYGLEKLELKADKGQELATLKGYLAGAKKSVSTGDSAIKKQFKTSFDVFDK